MNFYKHHLGDYSQATGHLSFVEDAAYSRLIRKYYAEEKPLPVDVRAIQRLVAARTDEERQAVADVLNEFFILKDDGWHNKRCDEELARANAVSDTNRRIALEREEEKRRNAEKLERERIEHALSTKRAQEYTKRDQSVNGSLEKREPIQTPDSTIQTPGSSSYSSSSSSNSVKSSPIQEKKTKDQEVLAGSVQPNAEAPKGGLPVAKRSREPTAGSVIWRAYVDAYFQRYSHEPAPSAKHNALCAQIAVRIPAAEHEAVVRWYVSHPGRFYVQNMHALQYLVKDVEKLRAEWVVQRPMLETTARNDEKRAATRAAFEDVTSMFEQMEKTL